VTSGDVGSGVADCEKLRIFRRRNIVGILTNKSLIAFPLTPKHVTLDDLKWPFCVKFFFVLSFWSSEAWLSKLGYSTLKLVVNVVGEV